MVSLSKVPLWIWHPKLNVCRPTFLKQLGYKFCASVSLSVGTYRLSTHFDACMINQLSSFFKSKSISLVRRLGFCRLLSEDQHQDCIMHAETVICKFSLEAYQHRDTNLENSNQKCALKTELFRRSYIYDNAH